MNTSKQQSVDEADPNVFDILGSPVRRTIIEILAKSPSAVGEIAIQVSVSRPAVSKHLRLMQNAGFVKYNRRGTRNLYQLEPVGFDAAQEWLGRFWADALSRYKLVAENSLVKTDDE